MKGQIFFLGERGGARRRRRAKKVVTGRRAAAACAQLAAAPTSTSRAPRWPPHAAPPRPVISAAAAAAGVGRPPARPRRAHARPVARRSATAGAGGGSGGAGGRRGAGRLRGGGADVARRSFNGKEVVLVCPTTRCCRSRSTSPRICAPRPPPRAAPRRDAKTCALLGGAALPACVGTLRSRATAAPRVWRAGDAAALAAAVVLPARAAQARPQRADARRGRSSSATCTTSRRGASHTRTAPPLTRSCRQ